MTIPVQRKLISSEELQEVIDSVHKYGAARKRCLGRDADDASFIAGVGCMFEALGMWNDMPPTWLINAMSGRPVFAGPAPKVRVE